MKTFTKNQYQVQSIIKVMKRNMQKELYNYMHMEFSNKTKLKKSNIKIYVLFFVLYAYVKTQKQNDMHSSKNL